MLWVCKHQKLIGNLDCSARLCPREHQCGTYFSTYLNQTFVQYSLNKTKYVLTHLLAQ